MKQLNTLDRVIVGAAAVAFITLFLPWYEVTVGRLSVTGSGGVAGAAGASLLVVAGVLLLFRRTGGSLLSGANGLAFWSCSRDILIRCSRSRGLPELSLKAG